MEYNSNRTIDLAIKTFYRLALKQQMQLYSRYDDDVLMIYPVSEGKLCRPYPLTPIVPKPFRRHRWAD